MATDSMVGPVVRVGEVADAVAEAARLDNPARDVRVEDYTAYLRISCADECVLRRTSIEEALGRPFEMRELEVNLASFSGQIETATDQVRFYHRGASS
jgi:toluene monooxygenase system protein D